ncbi:MAG TPA: Xaa-Pro peptidase family protein [Methylomirabilota bacterium]|nr:Xaa-Pro peptidase family protein [Methylomirabilota bacterium]
MYPHQAERLDGVLGRLGVQAVIAASPANVAYITGFRRLSCEREPALDVFAVYANGGTALVVPAVEIPALIVGDVVADHVIGHGRGHVDLADRADGTARRAADLIERAAPSAADGLAAALCVLGVADAAIGIDAAPLTETVARSIAARVESAKLEPASDALAEARTVKAPYEIECLQQALWCAEEAIDEVLGTLGSGGTERDAVLVYERALAQRGARATAARIAFGAHTALPVAAPGDRALRTGDLVRFDVGCALKGYHAAVARMAILGRPTSAQQRQYDAIEAGVDAALTAIRPGATAARVFAAVTSAVRGAGTPTFDCPDVGHAIGLDPAERPWLTADGPGLEAGIVLTVDLRWFELGAAGVQVKETVLVNRDGAAVMNRSHRGLVLLE